MKFSTVFKFLLFIAIIWQMIIVLSAEHAKEYAKATYEMLWLFFLCFLMEKETKDD